MNLARLSSREVLLIVHLFSLCLSSSRKSYTQRQLVDAPPPAVTQSHGKVCVSALKGQGMKHNLDMQLLGREIVDGKWQVPSIPL